MSLISSENVASSYSNDISSKLNSKLLLSHDDAEFVEANYSKGKEIFIATKGILDDYTVVVDRDSQNITEIAKRFSEADLSMSIEG